MLIWGSNGVHSFFKPTTIQALMPNTSTPSAVAVSSHPMLKFVTDPASSPKPKTLPTPENSLAGKIVESVALGRNHVLILVVDPDELRSELRLSPDDPISMTDSLRYNTSTSRQVFAWGMGSHGQLGLCHTNSVQHPTRVETLQQKRIVELAAGDHCSAAISWKGEVYIWGDNGDCGLGLGALSGSISTTRKLSFFDSIPVARVCALLLLLFLLFASSERSLICWFLKLEFGRNFVVALSRSGSLYSWGKNESGQLGLSDTDDRSQPHLIPSFCDSEIVGISCDIHKALAWNGLPSSSFIFFFFF